jgi:HEAT repeat protein
MISDPATEVRKWVAIALDSDSASFDLLLAQLPRESDDQVKGLIALGVADIGDVRSIGPLDHLLDDPSFQVENDGAVALAALWPKLHKDAELAVHARSVSSHILKLLPRATGPGTENLRGSLVKALASMQGNESDADPAILNEFHQLLDPHESVDVRQFAIDGIGNMGRASTADWIVPFLGDPDAGIRHETAKSLGMLNVPDYYPKLVDVLHDNDPDVRAAAWNSLQSWMSVMTEQQLVHTADALADPDHPDRELFAREALVTMLQKSPPVDLLALTWQRIGDLQLLLKSPHEAAQSYDKALNYWLSNGGHPATTSTLTEAEMTALLQSAPYEDAVNFASQVIKSDNADVRNETRFVCSKLDSKVASLETSDPAACRELIDAIEKMNPPFPDLLNYRSDIEDVRKRLARTAPTTSTVPAAR